MSEMLHTDELELSVIGSLCIEPQLISNLLSTLVTDDFTIEFCRKAFTLACAAQRDGKPFDAVFLADGLASDIGKNEAYEFVKLCMMETPTTANASHYAQLLHDKGAERRLSNAIISTVIDGKGSGGPKLAASVMARCRDFLELEKTGRTKSLADALDEMYRGLGQSTGIRVDTGLARLDGILKGIWGGNLCIVGARPGVGKSAFGLAVAEYVARSGGTVLIYSLEMLSVELAERMIARHGIKLDDIIDNNLDEPNYREIVNICSSLSKLPIQINDAPNLTISKIRTEAVTTHNLRLIIVDFLSLMKSERKSENRNLELGAISRDLKNLAAELQVPVIALAQLNRGSSDTEAPTLRSLRDSGELEQNANKVLLMWNTDLNLHHVGIAVAKNRRGRTGAVEVYFDGDHMRFDEIGFYHVQEGKAGKKWKPSSEDLPW